MLHDGFLEELVSDGQFELDCINLDRIKDKNLDRSSSREISNNLKESYSIADKYRVFSELELSYENVNRINALKFLVQEIRVKSQISLEDMACRYISSDKKHKLNHEIEYIGGLLKSYQMLSAPMKMVLDGQK